MKVCVYGILIHRPHPLKKCHFFGGCGLGDEGVYGMYHAYEGLFQNFSPGRANASVQILGRGASITI